MRPTAGVRRSGAVCSRAGAARASRPVGVGSRIVDPFADVQQPRCLECGTVLETAKRGYVCRGCSLALVDAITIAERTDPMR